MASKRNPKAIQIALTEDQIARVIQEAARTRRGLKAESLEDRIAPSRFGLPFDPTGGIAPPLPDGDPLGPLDPTPFDPLGVDPNDPTLAGGAPLDGGAPFDPSGGPPLTDNPPLPGDPPNPFLPGQGGAPQGSFGPGPLGRFQGPEEPGFPSHQNLPRNIQNVQQPGAVDPIPEEPTPEELADHRRNILRNLRLGNAGAPGEILPE